MYISKDEKFQIPATRLKPRALTLRGEGSREYRNEAIAPIFAPLAPDAHLSGIHGIVNELCRIGIGDNTDWNVSLCQFPPRSVIFAFSLAMLPSSPSGA